MAGLLVTTTAVRSRRHLSEVTAQETAVEISPSLTMSAVSRLFEAHCGIRSEVTSADGGLPFRKLFRMERHFSTCPSSQAGYSGANGEQFPVNIRILLDKTHDFPVR